MKRIVVLGGGFGGLTFAKEIDSSQAEVVLVDRQNHHLFQPLLYQVATAGLSESEIAQPIRSLLYKKPHLSVLMDEVKAIDLRQRKVTLGSKELRYDYLVIGLGAVVSYFGHSEWARHAPGLKDLDDAIFIRARVLNAFEKAETTENVAEQQKLMTVIVVGGGPTGVELAGAFSELARFVLKRDFDHVDAGKARIILIEGGPRILGSFPEDLSDSALKQLKNLGVEVMLNTKVKNISSGRLEVGDHTIEAENILWAAGVSPNPLTLQLGVELTKRGQIKVNKDCSVPGFPETFAVGDIAYLEDAEGKPLPGVSPVAMQMARHVAKLVNAELKDGKIEPERRKPFKYWDRGTMATIGRSSGVAMIGKVRLHGLLAWVAWLLVHLIFLIGFRNKIAVFLDWVYSYLTYRRGARIFTPGMQSMTPGAIRDVAPRA